jgi:RND superfamily putative drug exporter
MKNLNTGTLARWAGSRPWTMIGIWVILLVVAFGMISTLLGDALTTDDEILNDPESKQANTLLEQRLAGSAGSGGSDELIIVRSTTLTVDAPAYQSQVETLYADLIALGNGVVERGEHYYMTGDESLVSADRHTTILPLTMAPDADEVVEQVHGVVDNAGAATSFEVFVTGDASFEAEAMALAEETMKTGESIGIMVALVILALVFGAVAAATLPIAIGIVSVIGALGLTALVGQTMELSFFVTNIITMMGLAVGIDYSLFVLSRYREERERGLDKVDAIAAAGATASRAVLFSGMTVVLALVGLVIFPLSIFQSFGIGAILVVMVAVLASLTLLPAILGLFGDRVNAFRLRIPFVQRRKTVKTSGAAGGFWVRTTRIVTRRPVVALVVAGGLLIAAAVPYFGGEMGMSGISAMPDDMRAKQGFLVLQEEFGFGQDEPAVIVIDGQTDSEAVQQGVASLEATLCRAAPI